MKNMVRIIFVSLSIILLIFACNKSIPHKSSKTGSVIFIHPDGSGLSMWGALRLIKAGPDGELNWDKMDNIGIYRGHLNNSLSSSSEGGATVHAFGVKADYDAYGINPQAPIKSLSGNNYSIMTEALIDGKSVALINSGHLCEPGSGVFLANSRARILEDTISSQLIYSGADIIFTGGEVMLLPEGTIGFHGEEGIRKDGRNLLEEAEQLGFKVILTREELLSLPTSTKKVLGIFAARHTFNSYSEEELISRGLKSYNEDSPTLLEMTKVALKILEAKNNEFFIVIEEEGTDNLANHNNAVGALEALNRADDAIGYAMQFIDENPRTLLITAADSDAGAMQVVGLQDPSEFNLPVPEQSYNGSPQDGFGGTATLPFVAKPDQFGNELPFFITWSTTYDVMGAIIAKAHGLNSDKLPKNVDNTDIYRLAYLTLFGKELE